MCRPRTFWIAYLLCCLPTIAGAGQLKLRWDSCWGDGGVANRAFACDVNTGSNRLVASLIPNVAVNDVEDLESRIDLRVVGGSVPAWWLLHAAGSCRQSSLTMASVAPITANACVDWGGGGAIGGISAYTLGGVFGPGSANIQIQAYLPPPLLAEFVVGQEYFLFSVAINNLKTVGPTACAGCNLGVCLGLQYVELDAPPPVGTVTFNAFPPDTDWLATWQGGSQTGANCSFITATRASTWGSVKSLYR